MVSAFSCLVLLSKGSKWIFEYERKAQANGSDPKFQNGRCCWGREAKGIVRGWWFVDAREPNSVYRTNPVFKQPRVCMCATVNSAARSGRRRSAAASRITFVHGIR